MKLATIALLALAAAATSGCAGTAVVTTPASRPPPSGVDLTDKIPCFDGHQRLVGPKAVGRFHAVAALSCIDGERTYVGRGQWDVRVRRVAVGGVSRLQRYYERPSEPNLPKRGGCLLVAHFVLTPVLVDARGRRLAPRTPVDGCGEPWDTCRRFAGTSSPCTR